MTAVYSYNIKNKTFSFPDHVSAHKNIFGGRQSIHVPQSQPGVLAQITLRLKLLDLIFLNVSSEFLASKVDKFCWDFVRK